MITKDLNRADSFLQRFLEIIPGFMIWMILLSPLWAGKTIPLVMADILVILAVYWLYRAFVTTVGASIGIYKYKQAIKQDWLQKCHDLSTYNLPQPEDLPVTQFLPKHLLIYPQLIPQYAVLKDTLNGLRQQNYPKELIYIAVSFEERMINKLENYQAVFTDIETKLKAEFPEFADNMMFFVHPEGLPGEVLGAGPNRAWGGRKAVEELEKRGEVISDFLVTSPDEDIVFHPQFLAACTHTYLISEKRKQKFYQTALYTFNNNYWQVPLLIRVLVSGLTIPVLSSSFTEKNKRETFSCYTLSLEVLKAVDYWDTRYGIDDTTFYWRPFFYFAGDWECEVFYIPLSADAIYDQNYVTNHYKQYRQYLRWGWGVVAFPLGFKGLLQDKRVPFLKRVEKMYHLFEVFIFWKVLAYLLTIAIPLILFLNPALNELTVWYTIPQTLSIIMSISLIFLIPNTIYKAMLAPARPANWPAWRYYAILLIEAPMNIVTIFLYSTIPFVEASTRYMLGQKEAKAVSTTWATKVR